MQTIYKQQVNYLQNFNYLNEKTSTYSVLARTGGL